jgi:hypothetical protein
MLRILTLGLLLLATTTAMLLADDGAPVTIQNGSSTDSTLGLYFAPEHMAGEQGRSQFQPQVARLFVDDEFVGNAILNVHGNSPILKFGAGRYTIRVEMDAGRVFESKITCLGRGSTQILFVDFDQKPTPAVRY